jgi:hypothetical protein
MEKNASYQAVNAAEARADPRVREAKLWHGKEYQPRECEFVEG